MSSKPKTQQEQSLQQKYALLQKMQKQKEKQDKQDGSGKDSTADEKIEAAKKVLAKEHLNALAFAAETNTKKQKLPVKFQRRLDTGDTEILDKEKKLVEREKERVAQAAITFPTAPAPKRSKLESGSLSRSQGTESNSGASAQSSSSKEERPEEYYLTTVFVGDLPPDTDEKDLERLFGPRGPIENIRLISSKSFAFIKYYTKEAAAAAIAQLNGAPLGGVKIRVSRAKVPTSHIQWKSLDDPEVLQESMFTKPAWVPNGSQSQRASSRPSLSSSNPSANGPSAPAPAQPPPPPSSYDDDDIPRREAVTYDDL